MATDRYAVDVPDVPTVWLAVAAENYTAADLAVWKLRTALDSRLSNVERSAAEQAQLDQLMKRRQDAYEDLVQWVFACEAARQATT